MREVAYLGSVTRYAVELDRGETLVVLRQNLDMSAAQALAQRGRRVRLAWRPQDESVLDVNHRGGCEEMRLAKIDWMLAVVLAAMIVTVAAPAEALPESSASSSLADDASAPARAS